MATVCIFAKPPEAGRAKTRLIPAVGADGAAVLARAFLRDVWFLVDATDHQPVLATTDVSDRSFDLGEVERWPQGSGDLGARVETILRRGLRRGPTVALGADNPDLPPERLEELAKALERVDAAFVPAQDGGFVALGVRTLPTGTLDELPWSAPNTLDAVVSRLQDLGLAVEILDGWFDVDEPGDLAALEARLREGDAAPETRAALTRLGRW